MPESENPTIDAQAVTIESRPVPPKGATQGRSARPTFPEKHPTLKPDLDDAAMSTEAYTDHALAVRHRDRSQISAWRAFMAKFGLDGEPIDMTKKITEAHFFDVFGRGDPKMGVSEKLGLSYQYGQEKMRFLINMCTRSKDVKLARAKSIGRFDWDREEKPGNHMMLGYTPTPAAEPVTQKADRVQPSATVTPSGPAFSVDTTGVARGPESSGKRAPGAFVVDPEGRAAVANPQAGTAKRRKAQGDDQR